MNSFSSLGTRFLIKARVSLIDARFKRRIRSAPRFICSLDIRTHRGLLFNSEYMDNGTSF